ncbi:MAG: hypothetical protein WCD37_11830 [Chloroflexia bacterium]
MMRIWAPVAGSAGTWLRERPGLLREQRWVTVGVLIGLGMEDRGGREGLVEV